MFELDYWIEGIITKKWALVSLDLDKRVKSCGRLKSRGQSVNKTSTKKSLSKTNRKKKKSK